MNNDGSTKTVQAVETSLDIVEVLANIGTGGVSSVATEVGIPVSTTYVHLNTLRERGYVVKSGNEYRLSLRFLEHGGAVRQQLEFFTVVQDVVNQVAYATGEIAGFGIEEQGKRVILYRSEGENAVGDQIPIGKHSAMHWTSIGKAILAHLPDRRIDEIFEDGLQAGTEHTLTDREALRTELARIRERGYAIDDRERRRGIRGVAVPITNEREDVIGSIGIAGPRARLDSGFVNQTIDLLSEKRNIIEVRNDFYS